jgi:hypothetical protein
MDKQNLRDRVPDTVPDDVELFEQDGEVYGRDDHGEFALNPMAGSSAPQSGRCGEPLKFYNDRYGEIRYCTAMPESTFIEDGSDYCRNHKSREALMERAHELFKHGYFATNYVNFAEKLDAAKFLFAVEMVGGLFELSRHDFDIEEETRTIDATESNLIVEESVDVSLPVPSNDTLSFHANELWTAALKQVMAQNMQEAVFEEGMATKTLTDSADMEGQITDTHYESTEHHLHLPISRVAKDIKEHLKNGGVAIDDADSGVVTFQKNDYTLDVSPNETDSDGAESVSETATDFSEALKAEGENDAEIEVEVE